MMTAGHTLLSFVISVVLLFKLHAAKLARRRMSISIDNLPAKEVSYALILVTISFIHCAIYTPLSGFSIWYHSTNKTQHDLEDCGYSVGFPFLILDLLVNLTLVTHSLNLFVYLTRSRHFRRALLCCRARKWRALGDSTNLRHSINGRFSPNATTSSGIVTPNSKHLINFKSFLSNTGSSGNKSTSRERVGSTNI